MMFTEERQEEIIKILKKEKKVFVDELSKKFNVSKTTIRTDLTQLEERKLLHRTHGGAILPSKTGDYRTFEQKRIINLKLKQKIAKIAINFVEDNDTIAIDSGTTSFEFAKMLLNLKGLTIIINDFNIAKFLKDNSDFKVLFVGGFINKELNATMGDFAVDFLNNLKVDKVFVACESFDIKHGFSTPHENQAIWKKNLLNTGKEKYMLIDSSKFNKISTYRFARTDKFDYIISDKDNQLVSKELNSDTKFIYQE